jgi:hypothetical protein
MEKVENLCRTARARENPINTSQQISSRLRDVGLRHGAAPTIAAKTLPCSSSNFARFPSKRGATIMPPGRTEKEARASAGPRSWRRQWFATAGGKQRKRNDQSQLRLVGANRAVASGACWRQPVAGSQPLPDVSRFAVEFYECCANRGGGVLRFPKLSPQHRKLLAMRPPAA